MDRPIKRQKRQEVLTARFQHEKEAGSGDRVTKGPTADWGRREHFWEDSPHPCGTAGGRACRTVAVPERQPPFLSW